MHKLRNTSAKVRVKDKTAVLADLKGIYSSETYEEALASFRMFEHRWSVKYAREVQSWREDLDDLLCFYKYPAMIRYALYTTNTIERTIKEIRKRLKPMNSLTNLEAAEKIMYLFSTDYNETWQKRSLRGFADLEVRAQLNVMFKERYGTDPDIP